MNNFRMAYVIICHKNPSQVNKLIERLDNPLVDFFLHIDKKSNMENLIVKKKNVHFVEPVEVYWGHFSQIESMLNSFSMIQRHGYFNYIHVISGQDMPLVSNEHIINFFKRNQGKEYVEHTDINLDKNRQKLFERISVYYPKYLISRKQSIRVLRILYAIVVMKTKILKRSLRVLPNNIYKGGNWLSITGECMEYILNYVSDNPQYVDFFKNSFAGDEIFFHTIILNSRFKDNVVNELKRYTDWKTGKGPFPRTFTVEDVERIRNREEGMFWGRKFDYEVDKNVIDIILKDIDNTQKNNYMEVIKQK